MYKSLFWPACVLCCLAACSQQSSEESIMTNTIAVVNGVAIDGYDPVAYYQGEAKRGLQQFSTQYKDVLWYFSSAENMEAFHTAPDHYVPQYGGHCALATSLGQRSPGNPESWHIDNSKLFLHGNGVAKLFFKLIPGRQTSADKNWRNAN